MTSMIDNDNDMAMDIDDDNDDINKLIGGEIIRLRYKFNKCKWIEQCAQLLYLCRRRTNTN